MWGTEKGAVPHTYIVDQINHKPVCYTHIAVSSAQQRIQKQIAQLETRKAEAYLSYDLGEVSQSDYKNRCKKIDAAIIEQKRQLDALEQDSGSILPDMDTQACLLYPHSCILLRKKFHIVLVKIPCNFNPISIVDLNGVNQHLNHIPVQGPQVTERFQAVDLLTADSIHIRENAATVLFQGVQLPLLLHNGGINLFAEPPLFPFPHTT